MPAPAVTFRVTYQRTADVRDDVAQMGHGGLLIKVADAPGLELASPVALELVMPDGTALRADDAVLHIFPAVGVAISVDAGLQDQVRRHAAGRDAGTAPARHERIEPRAEPRTEPPRARVATAAPAAAAGPVSLESLTNAEKIQLALHGTRDQRNAILRDTNRTLHPFVLKNPQITTEDILAIAKSSQMTPDLLKQIADRKEWFQRPQIAVALARNPKTPPEVAVRALDHSPLDALRQMAKGVGAPPHVVQAARKKLLK